MNLSKEDIQAIMQYLNEQPTKFSLPLINWFNKKLNEQGEKPEAPQMVKKPEGKPADDKSEGGDKKPDKK